jgi:hypothetical protein
MYSYSAKKKSNFQRTGPTFRNQRLGVKIAKANFLENQQTTRAFRRTLITPHGDVRAEKNDTLCFNSLQSVSSALFSRLSRSLALFAPPLFQPALVCIMFITQISGRSTMEK